MFQEEYFNIFFDKEKNLLGKVSAKFRLGELYRRLGDGEKTAAAFDYVLQNGNLTYYTQKACEYLGIVDGENHVAPESIFTLLLH